MAGPRDLAPHVQAAIRRGAGVGETRQVAQPKTPGNGTSNPGTSNRSATPLAPHVQAAIQRCHDPAALQPRTDGASNAGPGGNRQDPNPPGSGRGAENDGKSSEKPPGPRIAGAPGNVVTYVDVKSPNAPPPPPRWPVYALHCTDGETCTVEDLKTGRTRPAGDMFAGYVRVSPRGPVYLSPRPAVGAQGDSHPTIASMTPEEQTGRKALVAAGEVGLRDSRIVGHNDKTGHYRTRRNLWQSGMPSDKYHPFTEDPKEWYGK